MASVMIIDNRRQRREMLGYYLEEAGYQVTGTGDAEGMPLIDATGIDLVVLNLYPDAFRTWELYLAFKEKHPHLPVLVYLQHSAAALKSIRAIIDSIIGGSRENRLEQNPDNARGRTGRDCLNRKGPRIVPRGHIASNHNR